MIFAKTYATYVAKLFNKYTSGHSVKIMWWSDLNFQE